MKILDISLDDGRKCAALLNAIKIAKFENLSVQDMESLLEARKWLTVLATEMAKELKGRKEGTASTQHGLSGSAGGPSPEKASNVSASPAPDQWDKSRAASKPHEPVSGQGIRVKKLTPGSPTKKGKK